MTSANGTLTLEEEREFDDSGCLVVPDALTAETVAKLVAALDELTYDEPRKSHNIADIFRLREEFLELIDLPTVLPKVQKLLGNNIWVNHSHLNVNPPTLLETKKDTNIDYGWHRDGGAINRDIPPPAPLLSIKVGFYLSDLAEPDRGQTYIIRGSHMSQEKAPKKGLPPTAWPLCVKPGTAVLIDRRTIHSIRSANTSNITRNAIFIQYAFRWLCPVDAMTVEHLRDRCDPIRLQLLGLSAAHHTFDSAEGRSGRYYPTDRDVPLNSKALTRIVRRIRSIPNRVLGRLWR